MKHLHDRVLQNLDKRHAKQVTFTVKKAHQVAYVVVHGLWHLLGQLCHKLGNVLDPNTLMTTISVVNLMGQVCYNLGRNLLALLLDTLTYELGHRFAQILLVIEQLNNLLIDVVGDIAD